MQLQGSMEANKSNGLVRIHSSVTVFINQQNPMDVPEYFIIYEHRFFIVT